MTTYRAKGTFSTPVDFCVESFRKGHLEVTFRISVGYETRKVTIE